MLLLPCILLGWSLVFAEDSSKRWICTKGACKQSKSVNNEPLTLETCRKTCTDDPIWPKPKYLEITKKSYSALVPDGISYKITAPTVVEEKLRSFLPIFRNYFNENPANRTLTSFVRISLQIERNDLTLNLGTDESYDSTVTHEDSGNISVVITAVTYFGARHGLESLSQLIWFDSVLGVYQILHDINIKDKPSFSHRGVLIDTSRNFFPLHQLKKIVDGMSYSKLNILHLHLTDADSFPIVLKNVEWLAEGGAFNSKSTYSIEDIEGLIEYGILRGVKVVLEVDAPSHVSAGWHSHPTGEKLVICDDDSIFKGQLNPDNPKSLETLQKIYENFLNLMQNDNYFHIGNDEVNLDCWEHTEAAKQFGDTTKLWVNYTNTLMYYLKLANKGKLPSNVVLWSSPLTNSVDSLSGLLYKDNLIVQYWYGNLRSIIEQNIRVIFSSVDAWYLDCGFGSWRPSQQTGVCDPYKTWQTAYTYKPWQDHGVKSLTVGGEVCLWSEEVAEESLETRIWPRAAAFSERVWSDPDDFPENVYVRLDNFREIIRSRGVQSSAIWPKWCTLNPGSCK